MMLPELPPEIVTRWRRNLTPRDDRSAPEPWRMGTREARVILQNNTPKAER